MVLAGHLGVQPGDLFIDRAGHDVADQAVEGVVHVARHGLDGAGDDRGQRVVHLAIQQDVATAQQPLQHVLAHLAGQVRENVLERLLRRGDILLDGQMNHALAPVISRAVETMTRDVHDTLNRLIRDIVARAVNEEITRLHAEMARQNHDD